MYIYIYFRSATAVAQACAKGFGLGLALAAWDEGHHKGGPGEGPPNPASVPALPLAPPSTAAQPGFGHSETDYDREDTGERPKRKRAKLTTPRNDCDDDVDYWSDSKAADRFDDDSETATAKTVAKTASADDPAHDARTHCSPDAHEAPDRDLCPPPHRPRGWKATVEAHPSS